MKRSSDRQLTKDDADVPDDSPTEAGTFQKATPEVLAKRRILKVRRSLPPQPSPDAAEQKPANPFAKLAVPAAGGNGTPAKPAEQPADAQPPSPAQNVDRESKNAVSEKPTEKPRSPQKEEDDVEADKEAARADGAEEEPAPSGDAPAEGGVTTPSKPVVDTPAEDGKETAPAAAEETPVAADEKSNAVPEARAIPGEGDGKSDSVPAEETETPVKKDEKSGPVQARDENPAPDEADAPKPSDSVQARDENPAPDGAGAPKPVNESAAAQFARAAAAAGFPPPPTDMPGNAPGNAETTKKVAAQAAAAAATPASAPPANGQPVKEPVMFGGADGANPSLTFANAAAANSGTFNFAPTTTAPPTAKKTPQKEFKEAQVETGEENEGELFRARAKMYSLDVNDGKGRWRERGVGSIKFKRHNETGKARLLMRTEGTLRLVLNTPVFPEFSVDRATERSLRFQGYDVDDTDGKNRTSFLIRFSTKDTTSGLIEAIEKWKESDDNKQA